MTSDNARQRGPRTTKTTSDNTEPRRPAADKPHHRGPAPATAVPRRGRAPTVLPAHLQTVLDRYAGQLAKATMLDDDTRRAYTSRARGYLAWLAAAHVDGDPLSDPAAHDGAVRDYRAHLQTVAKRKPATINTTLAALGDFYTRSGLGAPNAARLDLPKRAPRALDARDSLRWLRAVERWLSPRDRVVALLPYYAGLRLGEVVALDTGDVQLSARKGVITVRSGKNRTYREIPVHPGLHEHLKLWINDERPAWPGADSQALLLNQRGGRLSDRDPGPAQRVLRPARAEDLSTRERVSDLPDVPHYRRVPARASRTSTAGPAHHQRRRGTRPVPPSRNEPAGRRQPHHHHHRARRHHQRGPSRCKLTPRSGWPRRRDAVMN